MLKVPSKKFHSLLNERMKLPQNCFNLNEEKTLIVTCFLVSGFASYMSCYNSKDSFEFDFAAVIVNLPLKKFGLNKQKGMSIIFVKLISMVLY